MNLDDPVRKHSAQRVFAKLPSPLRQTILLRRPRYFEDDDPPGNLAKAVRSAILLADENGIERLAVPAISTGIYGYPPEEAVPIMVATAFELLSDLRGLKEIRFVVMEGRVLVLFADAFRGAHSGTKCGSLEPPTAFKKNCFAIFGKIR